MSANSAMLAAVRDTVVGLPEGSPQGSRTGNALSPPAVRRASSDQNPARFTPSSHSYSQSHSSSRPFDASPPLHSRSTSTNVLPKSKSASLDPFADRSSSGRTPDKSSGSREKKKGSRHADAIDKLDPSNFWGGMLHHESAYDAAAPSRNVQNSRGAAPMGAFNNSSLASPVGSSEGRNPKLSALANKTLEKMGSIKFSDDTTGGSGGGSRSAPAGEGDRAESYFDVLPTIPASSAASPERSTRAMEEDVGTPRATSRNPTSAIGRGLKLIRSRSRSRERKNSGGDKRAIPGVGSMPAEEDYYNHRAKDKKNALANAWGVADPEPFEDFSVMAAAVGPRGDTGLASSNSSIWNGIERNPQPVPALPPRKGSSQSTTGRHALTETYADEPGEEVLSTDNNHSVGSYGSNLTTGGTGVKRSKSLLQRFRNMRDSPNVPAAPEPKTQSPRSPAFGGPSSLPSSASSTSFAVAQQQGGKRGIFNRQGSARSDSSSLNGPPAPSPSSENSFVLVPSSINSTPKQTHHGRTRSRSELVPASESNSSLASLGVPIDRQQRDKSLPRLPTEGPSRTTRSATEDPNDPFADAAEHDTPPRPGAHSHPSQSSSSSYQRTNALGRTRSPVPPPAPIDLPGQDQSNLYPSRFTQEKNDGGGAQLGRKGSLMKRVLGRG